MPSILIVLHMIISGSPTQSAAYRSRHSPTGKLFVVSESVLTNMGKLPDVGLSISISAPKLKLFQRKKVTLQMHESAVVDPPICWTRVVVPL